MKIYRAKSLELSGPFPHQDMSRAALEAETLANIFGLGYLSREGFQKLADIIDHVKAGCTNQAARDGVAGLVSVSKGQRVG